MKTWIFQGTPDEYRVDQYLRIDEDIIWDVRQKHFRDKILEGDMVFIWRSKGFSGDESSCGIVAKGKILCKPAELPDEKEYLYVKKPANWKYIGWRVKIRLSEVRLNGRQGMLRKISHIKGNDVLKNMRIMNINRETNYKLSKIEAEEIEKLWKSRRRIRN